MKKRNGLKRMKNYKLRMKENRFVAWVKTLFLEEYSLTIWFVANKVVTDDGAEYTRTPKQYRVKRIKPLKPHLIKFEDLDGREVQIRSEEPMNWDLIKVY